MDGILLDRASCSRFEMLMIFFEWTIVFENIIFQVVGIERQVRAC